MLINFNSKKCIFWGSFVTPNTKSLTLTGVNTKRKSRHRWWKRCPNKRCGKTFCDAMWSEIMIMKYKQAIHYFGFLFSCYYVYIMLLIWSKNWNYVYWLLLFLIRSKYVYAQISVPKIGIPTSKRFCFNPWLIILHLKPKLVNVLARTWFVKTNVQ